MDDIQEQPTETNNTPKNNNMIVIGAVLAFILVIVGLFLPPISLGERLGLIEPEAEVVDTTPPVADGSLQVTTADGAAVSASEISQTIFDTDAQWQAAAAALPAGATLVEPLITLNNAAPTTGQVTLSIPATADPKTTDLYAWDGNQWSFMPSRLESNGQLTTMSGPLPSLLAFVQSPLQVAPTLSLEKLPMQELPAAALPLAAELVVGTLTLGPNGVLLGDVSPSEVDNAQYLRVTNTGIIVDKVSLENLLSDNNFQTTQIQNLVQQTIIGNFAGVNLDYQGVTPAQADAFTSFVTALATGLHGQSKQLIVTLAMPGQNNQGHWYSTGHDWAAVGQVADAVYVQMPTDPTAYAPDGEGESLLVWATKQVDRNKLYTQISSHAVIKLGTAYRELSSRQMTQHFGEVYLTDGHAAVDPGFPVPVALSGLISSLSYDSVAETYSYTYSQTGQDYTVWFASPHGLGSHLNLAQRFNLRGAAVQGLEAGIDEAGYAAALQSYLMGTEVPAAAGTVIAWEVLSADGGVTASGVGDTLEFTWEGSQTPGNFTIQANLAQGDYVTPLGNVTVAVQGTLVANVDPTTAPEPTATTAAGEEPAGTDGDDGDTGGDDGDTGGDDGDTGGGDGDTGGGDDEPTPTPTAAPNLPNPSGGIGVINIGANVRSGPGLGYATIAGGKAGDQITLIGRDSGINWYNIMMPDGTTEGWIFSPLVDVDPSFDTGALPVVEVDPPPVAGGGDPGDPAPAPPPPPVAIGEFELGGQTHSFANPALMSYSGMTWVKFQHKWSPGDTAEAVRGRIDSAHANGFKVLLSMPGSNTYPSSIDFAGYINFLGQVAALGPDAIEVWNEMNIDFEWPAGSINPTSYVNDMLAPAYNAIKSANPNVMVISGAPAPTGFDNGHNAWADDRYMAGVAAAGGGNYMDCIGVHHNAGATSPNATSGHPANSDHYSWYFWPTLNMYYNTFGGARKVCFTELGYLSGDDYGGLPANFSWASSNSISEHAQWLAEATSLSASSGKVRMLIIFNVDFTYFDMNGDPQAGYGMIRADGSCPSCDLLRNVMP